MHGSLRPTISQNMHDGREGAALAVTDVTMVITSSLRKTLGLAPSTPNRQPPPILVPTRSRSPEVAVAAPRQHPLVIVRDFCARLGYRERKAPLGESLGGGCMGSAVGKRGEQR